jgi:GT2 family glycosyltransferase
MKPQQVSTSIVAYKNDPEEIVAAIRSALSAEVQIKCTVVDNSPTQALRPYVTEVGANYIHAGRNLGFGGGHNVVLREEDGASEYHLVLNPDVRFTPEVPSALYRFMNENQNVGLVMPRVLSEDGSEQRLCKQLPSPFDLLSRRFLGDLGATFFGSQLRKYELRHLDLDIPREIPCLSGCFMFLRTKALREVGFFDERYFMYMEDVDLCRRIGERYKTAYYPEVAVTHGYAKGSYSSGTLLKYHMQSAIAYFRKWGWIYDGGRQRLNQHTAPLALERARREGDISFGPRGHWEARRAEDAIKPDLQELPH